MTIAICSHCGGLVLKHATMCGHCGERGEARVARDATISFGRSRRKQSIVMQRLAIAVVTAFAMAACVGLAHIARPSRTGHELEYTMMRCETIRQNGEERPGDLSVCLTDLARIRAAERSQ